MSATDWNTDSYAQAALEDRSARRRRINMPATLRPAGSKSFETVVLDISLGGFSANALQPINRGNRCWLTLAGIESLQAEVVWWDAGRVGCAFAKLLSPIVFESLLVRYRGDGVLRRV